MTARYLGREGKHHRFEVIAADDAGEIFRGQHIRAVVEAQRLEKAPPAACAYENADANTHSLRRWFRQPSARHSPQIPPHPGRQSQRDRHPRLSRLQRAGDSHPRHRQQRRQGGAASLQGRRDLSAQRGRRSGAQVGAIAAYLDIENIVAIRPPTRRRGHPSRLRFSVGKRRLRTDLCGGRHRVYRALATGPGSDG